MDENEAINRLKCGDIDGLAFLVEQYWTEAVRTAYLITQDRALAEDIAQSAFIRVYERIAQFDEQRPFPPWFFRIVTNMALKTQKQHQGKLDFGIVLEDMIPFAGPDPEEIVTTREKEKAVRAALQRLSPKQRAVIVLRYYHGFTEREIADTLVSPLGTIRWRIHAARQNLHRLLAPVFHPDAFTDKVI